MRPTVLLLATIRRAKTTTATVTVVVVRIGIPLGFSMIEFTERRFLFNFYASIIRFPLMAHKLRCRVCKRIGVLIDQLYGYGGPPISSGLVTMEIALATVRASAIQMSARTKR